MVALWNNLSPCTYHTKVIMYNRTRAATQQERYCRKLVLFESKTATLFHTMSGTTADYTNAVFPYSNIDLFSSIITMITISTETVLLYLPPHLY